MQNFNKKQRKLALTLARTIEDSGCNVGECITVLIVLGTAVGLIGRHAPNPVEIERVCAALSREFTQSAQSDHLMSDLKQSNTRK